MYSLHRRMHSFACSWDKNTDYLTFQIGHMMTNLRGLMFDDPNHTDHLTLIKFTTAVPTSV